MTIKKLIEELSKLDENKEVVIQSTFDGDIVEYSVDYIEEGNLRSEKLDFQLEGIQNLFDCIGFMEE